MIPATQCTQCPRCSTSQPASQGACLHCALPLGLIQERYQLKEPLEQGGVGDLYLALDTHEQSEVVLKAVQPEILRKNRNAPLRFQREIRTTRQLSERSHHVVQFLDAGEDPVMGHFMILEYLQGHTLRKLLDTTSNTKPDLAFHIFFQLCEVLSEAHVLGYIHRDLKPDNVFVIERYGDPYFVKLLDFGLVKPLGDTAHPGITKGILGSPLYMAPEQTCASKIDERTDVYALGLVMYEMLTGSPTFKGNNIRNVLEAQMYEAPTPLALRRPDLHFSLGLNEALLKAIAKRPNARYDSIQEFAQHMAEFSPVSNEEWGHPIMRSLGFTTETQANAARFHTTLDLPLGLYHTTPEAGTTPVQHLPTRDTPPPAVEWPISLDTPEASIYSAMDHTENKRLKALSSFWVGLFFGLMLAFGALLNLLFVFD